VALCRAGDLQGPGPLYNALGRAFANLSGVVFALSHSKPLRTLSASSAVLTHNILRKSVFRLEHRALSGWAKPSKMAMWQMHGPWARPTVAPEAGQTPFPFGFAPGPSHYRGRAFFTILLGAAFALRTLRVARDLGWCDHDHPRWGGHTMEPWKAHLQFPPFSAHRLLIMGSELPRYGVPALCRR
jgi:hypothetical protein